MLIVRCLYWKYTQDTPEGNFADMRRQGISTQVGKKGGWDVMKAGGRELPRLVLAACYGASFGVELFVHSIAVTYYFNTYQMLDRDAGLRGRRVRPAGAVRARAGGLCPTGSRAPRASTAGPGCCSA